MFTELISDTFHKEYSKYEDCVLDYVLLSTKEYKGIDTHKIALHYSIDIINNRYDTTFTKGDNLIPNIITKEELFTIPNNKKDYPDTNPKPYWYLFLNPPYQTKYDIDDFIKINNILFPKGTDNLEIYEWNTDWSDYFLEGLEWWGARCLSIYDKTLDRIIIILASSTD